MKAVTIFGSNSGDKQALILQAIEQLKQVGTVVASSSFYETEPWGFSCDEQFLNQITVFETTQSPIIFLKTCLETERQLGRIRTENGPRYSSRPIDIDLLFCDNLIIQTPELTIPHPRISERNFVLVPLTEIMPDFQHPVFAKSLSQLLEESTDPLQVHKIHRF